MINAQLKDQNIKLIESLKNMKGLVTTMYQQIESMKNQDLNESWR